MYRASDLPATEVLLAQLFEGLTKCRDLVGASGGTLSLHANDESESSASFDMQDAVRCNRVLQSISQRHGIVVPDFVWRSPGRQTSLDIALSKVVGLTTADWTCLAGALENPGFDDMLGALKLPLPGRRNTLKLAHLPVFDVWTQGQHNEEAFFIVPPAGVPAALFRPWMDELGKKNYVVLLENPALFGNFREVDVRYTDLDTEVELIRAAVEALSLKRVHFIGICGGAPVAIAASAVSETNAASLLICHGDLYFGPETPRTAFQQQFQGFLSEATMSLAAATQVRTLFLDPAMLFGVPENLAPFILYPYANAELFHRYARSNFARMAYDATQAAACINCNTLIVTSLTDRMTHPEASRMLHKRVVGSLFKQKETGSHHDALLPTQEMLSTIQALASGDIATLRADQGAT
jgi:pimeloyl-ACP methyl ester carboxylesterase